MSNGEEDLKNRAPQFSGPPDGYVRKQDIFKTIGAAVGVLGAVLGLIGLNNSYREYVDRLILNERNERINQFNRLDQKTDACCGRRR